MPKIRIRKVYRNRNEYLGVLEVDGKEVGRVERASDKTQAIGATRYRAIVGGVTWAIEERLADIPAAVAEELEHQGGVLDAS